MRAVAQRVAEARVRVEGRVVGEIAKGLLVYLGVGTGDDEAAAVYMADKLAGLRVFEDEAGKMSLDVSTVGGAVRRLPRFGNPRFRREMRAWQVSRLLGVLRGEVR